MKPRLRSLVTALALLPLTALANGEEKRLERLEAQNRELNERLEALASMLEEEAGSPMHHSGGVIVGGYGSMKYTNLESGKKLDFHRFVLYFGKRISERVRFESELELEHAMAGASYSGAVELEQAYLAFDLDADTTLYTGLFLIPAGIVNETHEPTTFYSVYRPKVEKYIIPTTWWEGGAMLNRRLSGGWSVDVAVHSGLETSAGSDYKIRSGRQRVSSALADSLATTGRLKWTGMPGVELAATVLRQGDITQGQDPQASGATLWSAHAILQRGPFGVRALIAEWRLDGDGPKAVGADRQRGWYVEPALRPWEKWGFFVRYETWNNKAGDNGGEDTRQGNIGVNFWPHPDVVFKAEYQKQSGSDDDGVLLGMGYRL